MKNILHVKPSQPLEGREKFSFSFVDKKDLKGKNILDIGCGYGWFEYHSIKKGILKICGIEYRDIDLKTAKKYLKSRKIELSVGSAIDLPFKDNQFDTVVSWEVIEHIPQNTENVMLSEIYRVLKKNGTAYISTPNNTFLSNIFDPAWWLTGHRHYSISNLLRLSLEAGFYISKLEVRAGWWTITSLLHMYISKWIFRFNLPFRQKILNLSTLEYFNSPGFANIYIQLRKK